MTDQLPTDTELSHLVPRVTDRGFKHLPAIDGAYGGTVRVYESSAADAPHVWLGAVCDDAPTHPKTEVVLHLTAGDAVRLAEQLRYLVVNHHLGTGTDD